MAKIRYVIQEFYDSNYFMSHEEYENLEDAIAAAKEYEKEIKDDLYSFEIMVMGWSKSHMYIDKEF
ncbi:MAG: hypothetical protein GX465_16190 [Acidobacteria bacterium]|nr:hypothetical protein [Acidobacteriota bacterium]